MRAELVPMKQTAPPPQSFHNGSGVQGTFYNSRGCSIGSKHRWTKNFQQVERRLLSCSGQRSTWVAICILAAIPQDLWLAYKLQCRWNTVHMCALSHTCICTCTPTHPHPCMNGSFFPFLCVALLPQEVDSSIWARCTTQPFFFAFSPPVVTFDITANGITERPPTLSGIWWGLEEKFGLRVPAMLQLACPPMP